MNKNWVNILVAPSASILDVLKVMDEEALRMALVVDGDRKLLGVVADGDIRRGLLAGIQLTHSIECLMNAHPFIAEANTSKEQLVESMENRNILAIPILKDGIVIGLETLQDILKPKSVETPVFIMAGGFGTRLKPLTDSCPKPMLRVGNKPILETVINSFAKSGFVNFYISTHYMPEQIESHFGDGSTFGDKISYVYEEKPQGTGGALGLLPKTLPKNLPIIVINGDILTKVDFQRLLDFHEENKADATMCVREYDYQIPYGVINGSGHKVISMVEKPIQRFFVNAGIYVLSPDVVSSVKKNQHIDMPTLLEEYMKEKNNVCMFPIHEYWLDIGRMDDFNRAQSDIHTLGML